MTGIELLRLYAGEHTKCDVVLSHAVGMECSGFDSCTDCRSTTLTAIADQIERETLPRPLFEDGEPVQFGDAVCCYDGYTLTVDAIEVMRDGWCSLSRFACGVSETIQPGERVKRPEQPDTWEHLTIDVDTGRGFEDMDKAETAAEVLRRCKALAGVE